MPSSKPRRSLRMLPAKPLPTWTPPPPSRHAPPPDHHRPHLVHPRLTGARQRSMRAAAKRLRLPHAAEQRYVGALRIVMREVRHAAERHLAPSLSKIARTDAASPT